MYIYPGSQDLRCGSFPLELERPFPMENTVQYMRETRKELRDPIPKQWWNKTFSITRQRNGSTKQDGVRARHQIIVTNLASSFPAMSCAEEWRLSHGCMDWKLSLRGMKPGPRTHRWGFCIMHVSSEGLEPDNIPHRTIASPCGYGHISLLFSIYPKEEDAWWARRSPAGVPYVASPANS